MTNPKYYQSSLPGINKQIMLCSCDNPSLDTQYGRLKRPHTFREGYYLGRPTGKLWYCNSCGIPYLLGRNNPLK